MTESITQEIERLESEVAARRDRLYELEKSIRAEENAKLVGRCFKYSNSYGTGERWWVYYRIYRLQNHEPLCRSFQQDCHGEITINLESLFVRNENQIEISAKEFDREWHDLLLKLVHNKDLEKVKI